MIRHIHILLVALIVSPLLAQQDEDTPPQFFYTHHGADGNRIIAGTGTFPDVQMTTLTLEDIPMWVVGAAANNGLPPSWAVVFADGSVQGTFQDLDGNVTVSPVLEKLLPGQMPPVFLVDDFGALPVQTFPDDISILSNPVTSGDRTAYVADNGDLVVLDDEGEQIGRLPFGALPDARLVLNADGTQIAVYIGATDQRYVHGIMGDSLEAAALMVVNLEDAQVPVITQLDDNEVFEGLSPIWADVDEDGIQDLITTVSFSGGGAQIRVYRASDGSLLASGAAIGSSNRWRHQLAWAAFGPLGEYELVEVLTPHIGGVVGFYHYDGGDGLVIDATRHGYSSHAIGSRNLDMAVAGDFDGDGQPEIVVPNQVLNTLVGLAHTAEGTAEERWSIPLDSVITTNLAAIQLPDGRLGLAVGVKTLDNTGALQVFLPR